MDNHITIEGLVSEFRGQFPEVPVANGVNLEELLAAYGDDDPVFITLPIAEIGAISRDKLIYDENFVNLLAQQINEKRPYGIRGHEMDINRHPDPEFFWLGAKIDETGKLWAKAYVRAGSPAREEVKARKAMNSQIGTSVFGLGSLKPTERGLEVESFDLIRLDVGDPSVVSLPPRGDFTLTKQTIGGTQMTEITEEIRNRVIAEYLKENDTQQVIAQLRNDLTQAQQENEKLKAELEKAAKEKRELAAKAFVAEFTSGLGDTPAAQNLRKLFQSRIVAEFATSEIKDDVVKRVWDDEFKELSAAIVVQTVGGAANVPTNTDKDEDPYGKPLSIDELVQMGIGG